MGSSSKKRQTMAKMNRERAVKEKRALKAEKREAKKLAAAEGGTLDLEAVEDERVNLNDPFPLGAPRSAEPAEEPAARSSSVAPG